MKRKKDEVEARDLTEYKVGLIEENIARMELENIHAVCRDATVPDEAWKEKADIVLADLPCSGLGVFGKKPDLKYRVKEEDLKELAGLQRKILENAQAMVKKEVHYYIVPVPSTPWKMRRMYTGF